ncbi:hypothetical protein E2C01_005171 [Portunus trituberculatus]|uniref:Uncharacterized protein n=1 Tax=Portunus trituberculatus TaxID=210409 RepID=A0A5B7CYE7_PORTR|nr:hypothetical protein [Portunus trituberculatus]
MNNASERESHLVNTQGHQVTGYRGRARVTGGTDTQVTVVSGLTLDTNNTQRAPTHGKEYGGVVRWRDESVQASKVTIDTIL